ncbi:MAG: helix-turn-helix transcriptional regulator [Anaerolineae bacterium]
MGFKSPGWLLIESGSQLARLLGLDRGTVNHWLAGRRVPRPENIEKLSQVTGTPKEEIYRLLGRIEPLQSDNPEREARRKRLLYLFDQVRDKRDQTSSWTL